MNQKGFVSVAVVAVLVLLVGVAGYFVLARKSDKTVELTPRPTPTVTTSPQPNGQQVVRRVGEKEGYFLIQKINANSVDGLWYQAYPVAMLEGTPRTIHLGEDIGYACEGVSEKLISIDFTGQTITFNKIVSQPPRGGCPI